MGRRNQGPRLRWLEKRGAYYITWTQHGAAASVRLALQTANELKRSSASGSKPAVAERDRVIQLRSS
jgi:hypothetical protein